MKTVLWVDDLRDPPNRADERYVIARSVNEAKRLIEELDQDNWMDYWIDGTPIEELSWFDVIDLDHDAGIYAAEGGDYISVCGPFQRVYRHRTGLSVCDAGLCQPCDRPAAGVDLYGQCDEAEQGAQCK